jgi:hypothetical protein
MDDGKAEELKHRLGMGGCGAVDLDHISDGDAWPLTASFFGLSPEEVAPPVVTPTRMLVDARFALFEHQRSVVRRAYDRIGMGHGRTMIHMPTGAGKTRTAMHLVARTLNENEPCVIVWLAASRELLEQASEAFEMAWAALGNREIQVHRFWGAQADRPDDLRDGLLVAGLAKMHAWRERDAAGWVFGFRALETHSGCSPPICPFIETGLPQKFLARPTGICGR